MIHWRGSTLTDGDEAPDGVQGLRVGRVGLGRVKDPSFVSVCKTKKRKK